MAIITAVKRDPFEEKFKKRGGRSKLLNQFGFPRNFSHVRRPFRGIVIKNDTYATIEVFESDGTPVPLFNAGAREPQDQLAAIFQEQGFVDNLSNIAQTQGVRNIRPELIQRGSGASATDTITSNRENVQRAQKQLLELQSRAGINSNLQSFAAGLGQSLRYSNFLLQSSQEARQEKYQIMETFGIPYIFFFGERPRIYNFEGILLNSLDFQWRTEFWANYEHNIRGTRLVERDARMVLSWDDIMVEGYVLQATAAENSSQPHLVNFSFQMFITNYQSLADIGNTRFPVPFAVSIDTSIWKNDQLGISNLENPAASNVDAMRKYNLQKAAEANGGSPGLLGTIAKGLAVGSALSGLASSLVEDFTKKYEETLNGREVRYPVGGFPIVDEILKREDLKKILDGPQSDEAVAQQIALGLDPSTKELIASGATDPFGTPQIFVQDASLIVDLTTRYNQRALRRIKILPPGGVFSPPSNENYFGGLIRDALDEYVDNSNVNVTPYEVDNDAQQLQRTKMSTDDIIKHMIKELRKFGAPLGRDTLMAMDFVKEFGTGASVLRLNQSAGSFDASAASSAPIDTTFDAAPADVAAKQQIDSMKNFKSQSASSPKVDTLSPKYQQLQAQAVKSFKDTGQIDSSILEQLRQIQNQSFRPEDTDGTAPPGPLEPRTTKIITADGVAVRPTVIRSTISGPNTFESPETDRATLDRLLKQARQFNARNV